MDKPLDELYLEWLYSQVADPRIKDPNRTYWWMLRQFLNKEFVWIIPNDDNRIADGKELRYEFINAEQIQDVELAWIHMGCSMLELLIGLSRRLAFEAEGEPRDWFWHLVTNINLDHVTDFKYLELALEDKVDEVLNRVIWRQYSSDGHGGLFPLRDPKHDQTRTELWYQLSEYVIEAA